MHNDIFAVAAFTDYSAAHQDMHLLSARYFFSQFWCEFTKEVITEFVNEDLYIKATKA